MFHSAYRLASCLRERALLSRPDPRGRTLNFFPCIKSYVWTPCRLHRCYQQTKLRWLFGIRRILSGVPISVSRITLRKTIIALTFFVGIARQGLVSAH